MEYSFAEALRGLGPDAPVRVMNEARPESVYLFNRFLPERTFPDYHIEGGSLTIRALMAGLVGMDSPYPEATAVEDTTFNAESAKIAASLDFSERMLRRLQSLLRDLRLGGGDVRGAVTGAVLNFYNLVRQSHTDTAEYLRGQALLGNIDWTFNRKRLLVDYGVPAANKLAERTGNDAYHGSASKFWDDNLAALRLLGYNRLATLAHPTTFHAIIGNPANNIQVIGERQAGPFLAYTLRRTVAQNGVNTPSPDVRDSLEIITYGHEGEVLDPATPNATKKLSFLAPGKLIHIGRNQTNGYVVGAGAAAPTEYELGYTHIAPTVEGGGAPGRWARSYQPEARPWALRVESVANLLPVVEAPEKLVVGTTAMPA